MKKIFIANNNGSRELELETKKTLELLGYEVLPPQDSHFIIMDQEKFANNYCTRFKKYIENSDAILVLNPIRDENKKLLENYVTGLTFLEMYDSHKLEHDIYLYNNIPYGQLFNEVKDLKPIIIEGNLLNIDKQKNNLLKYFSENQLNQIREYDMYSKAFIICYVVFHNIKDESGQPYFEHLFRVSQKLYSEVEETAGLLHDIVEDTDITYRDLLDVGFPLEVIEIVKLVTKEKIDKSKLTEEEKLKLYDKEINKIINSGNIHAIRLKYADMTDNFNHDRIKKLSEEKQEWLNKKYGPQLVKLKKAKKEGDILW